ncbi:NAD(P)H-hydrate dehydratase [Sphingomonas arantia]|uniref:Bifunctional NAD(P)H-hydrate repair enzyme n=1 Tax=Sphingomonas arantia TaxID=1460676 RepID=A0ABW4TXS9_9SPHN
MSGRPILTAAAMRAAEAACMAGGTGAGVLMDRAGAAVAKATWRFAAGAPTLVLCGPRNNGGDGYVVARMLRERGVDVTVAALGEPRSAHALAARVAWGGPVVALDDAPARAVLVDALFGTGLARGLEPAVAAVLVGLAGAARVRIAVDVPSGVATDDGATFGTALPIYDMTVALGALKPAHRLQPAAALCGRVVVADIGVPVEASELTAIGRPSLPAPGAEDHKYTRGMVAVLSGAMGGAALLAATAAQRAGAGYVVLAGGSSVGGLHALVHRQGTEVLADSRVDAVLCGPGLGRGAGAERTLVAALACGRPLVLDADALRLVSPAVLRGLAVPAIVTPHAGEFEHLFGTLPGSRIDRARAAAAMAQCVVVLKGADTVIAAPDGRVAIADPAPAWLATAGTGDVLAGLVAAMRARIDDPFAAAQAAVWLHGAAAEAAGAVLVADDLLDMIRKVVSACQ